MVCIGIVVSCSCRLREFNRIAVDVGGVGDLDFECVTKMDDISILLIRSDNQ